ncbi:ATP-binding protein [Lentzea sp. NPDC051208]|uniref:ATP-binding protein n=1 Tax=Lentzea sp. NPDC051208 TaxID=3154642 RepID=UPI003443B829
MGREWAVERCLRTVRTARRTLLVHGPPASGKTTLARRVHQSLDTAEAVAVLHECHANDDATLLPWRLVDTIVRELCARSAPYAEALAATLGRRVEIRSDISVGHAVSSEISAVSVGTLQLGLESPRSMFSRCVQAPLESIENPPRVVLIVDAVDETNSPGLDNELVLLLTAALRGLANSPLDFRLVLTCRTVEQDKFRHLVAEVVDLVRDEPRAGDDMLLFCRSRFATTGSQPDDRAELVAAKAEGNYLYAKYAIGLLREPGAALDAAELPAGLGDVYREYLTRRVANDLGGRDWRARYRPVLGLLAVAREPGLTVGDLVAVLRLPESAVEDTVDDLSEFLRADPRTSRWGIFHDSFRTFLLADDALRIRSEEAHQVLGEAFLASGPLSAPEYLLQNFAYHLHGAGMHRELCEYATSADRWQEHEQRTGVLLSVRFTTLLTACDSAIALDSPECMVRLMVRDLELRSQRHGADPDLAAQDVDRLAADALVQLGDYDVSVIWQLVRACQEVEDGQRAAAAARLRDLAGWATRSLGGDWQYPICGLLAHLRVADPDGPVRGLCHALLDDVGVGFLKRHLFERGATTAALEEPEISDSHHYRYGVLRYAVDLAEKRCDPAGAMEVARHVHRSASPTLFEDLAFCAAASWNAVDGVAEALARLSDYRVLHADALAARGRPDAAEDQDIRTRARAELAGLLRDSSYPNDQWISYHSAVAARRDGDPVEARRILRSLRERMPRLDSAPDGAFVAGNHLDAVHGPCLQGLVLLMGMEAATVRDFALAEDLAAELIRFGAVDGGSVLVHLVERMVAAEEDGLADEVLARLTALLGDHLDGEDAGAQLFCAGVALRDLRGDSERFTALAARGLRVMTGALVDRVLPGGAGEPGWTIRALAAALTEAFDPDPATAAELVKIAGSGAKDDGDWSAFEFLGTAAGGRRALALLEESGAKRVPRHHVLALRDRLAEQDHLAAAEAVTAHSELDWSAALGSARMRAAARAGGAAAVLEFAKTNEPISRAGLLHDALEVLDGDERFERQVREAIDEAARRIKGLRTDARSKAVVSYLLARLRASTGQTEAALKTHNAATAAYEKLVDSFRWMNITVGGNPYLNVDHDDPAYDAFENNVAATVLDADRQLAVALVRGGAREVARDVVLGMAGLGGTSLPHHVHTMWTIGGATEHTRTLISARAAAECGFGDLLRFLLAGARDRGALAAEVAERMPATPVRQDMLMVLCANALGRRGAAPTTLARLVFAAPSAAVAVEPARWLRILRETGDAS